MSTYININTLEYPLHEGDIRLKYPNITEDQTGETFPCPEEFALVKFVEPPSINVQTQIVRMDQPKLVDGVWTTQWTIIESTDGWEVYQKYLAKMEALQAKHDNPTSNTANTTGNMYTFEDMFPVNTTNTANT
jgi:hypothetical protein